MKINVMATGSSGNCYSLEHGDDCILLDAGVSIDTIYKNLGDKFQHLKGVLLSHEHADHSKGIPKLLKQFVNVLCTKETAEALSIPLNNICLTMVSHGNHYSLGNWIIQCFALEHDTEQNMGFLIQYAGEDDYVAYITDTAFSKYKLPPLTDLIVECSFTDEKLKENYEDLEDRFVRLKTSHMSLKRLLKMLDSMDTRRLKTIVLVHLSDLNSDAEVMKSEVEKATGAKVWIADKGVEIEL